MARLQSDLPRSEVPVAPTRGQPVRALSARSPLGYSRYALLIGGLLILALLTALGIAAGRASESFAIGVIAADLVFLIGVATWSSIYGGGRR